jgi:hypothetical protein
MFIILVALIDATILFLNLVERVNVKEIRIVIDVVLEKIVSHDFIVALGFLFVNRKNPLDEN